MSQAAAEGLHLLPSPLFSLLLQVVHLDNMKHEEEIQKLPLQPPYYDMAASEPSPYADKLVRRRGILSPGLAALPPGSLTPRKQRPQKPAGAPAAFRGQEHPIPEGGNPRARSTDWWPCFSTCPLASIGTPTGVLGVIPH